MRKSDGANAVLRCSPPVNGPRSTVRVITEPSVTNRMVPPNGAFELLELIDSSINIEIPVIPTAEVGVAIA